MRNKLPKIAGSTLLSLALVLNYTQPAVAQEADAPAATAQEAGSKDSAAANAEAPAADSSKTDAEPKAEKPKEEAAPGDAMAPTASGSSSPKELAQCLAEKNANLKPALWLLPIGAIAAIVGELAKPFQHLPAHMKPGWLRGINFDAQGVQNAGLGVILALLAAIGFIGWTQHEECATPKAENKDEAGKAETTPPAKEEKPATEPGAQDNAGTKPEAPEKKDDAAAPQEGAPSEQPPAAGGDQAATPSAPAEGGSDQAPAPAAPAEGGSDQAPAPAALTEGGTEQGGASAAPSEPEAAAPSTEGQGADAGSKAQADAMSGAQG